MKKALIIANGPKFDWQDLVDPYQQDCLIVLDGAYNAFMHSDLPIHGIIGDMDSITHQAYQCALNKKIPIFEKDDQNTTDLHKAIEYLDEEDHFAITIVTGTDGRMDHTLHNIQQLSKHYQQSRPITLLTSTELITLVKDKETTIHGHIGAGISLIGAPHAIITSNGLAYDLENTVIEWCQIDSTSNALQNNYATISVRGSALLIEQRTKENQMKSSAKL
ncbi:MAG: thiamine diphosphokinase [Coxiellaceae bacterium]|nr:thiamine diphosphokinase [Coxiellaceae bacterium]